jgi:hypothetical protein
MATPPLICNPTEFQGSLFQRCDLQVVNGNTIIRQISFCDIDISLERVYSFNGCIYPNSSLALISEEIPLASFILIRAKYPMALPVSSRFITIIYKGEVLPMSDLTILTGNINTGSPGNSFFSWDLSQIASTTGSPSFLHHGMILQNPHSVKVNIEVILGS